MAEEIVDLIEETSDVDDWIYYDKDSKSDTNSVTNILNDTEQQLVYTDQSELIINSDDEHHDYQYDEYNELDANDIPCENELDVNEENNEFVNDDVEEDDLSKHTLILRETIDDASQLVEGYFCQQCSIPYKTIEAFLQSHQCTELFNENPAQRNSNEQESQDKLWDLVDNIEATDDNDENDIIEIKNVIKLPETSQENDNSASGVDLDKERYFCYECQKVFTDLTTAEKHDCSNQVDIKTNLINETPEKVSLDSSDNVLRCDLCNKNYPSLRSFQDHQRWHKRSAGLKRQTKTLQKQTVICEICNTIFESEKNLKLHMKMHKKHTLKTIQDAIPVGSQNEYNSLNQFFCELCNKSFDQKLLGIHKNMHQNVEEYNCGKCNRQFENLPSYEIHLQMHSSDSGSYVKKISPSKKLNDLVVNTESPSTSTNVDGGTSGQRKHACQYCGKEFQRPYEKVKHERIHTGEKPYDCEVCGKKFRVAYSLTLHLRTHTDIRPYVCGTCNKRFKQQSVYVHHMKTHVNERSYKCDICGKSFRTSVQLSGHKNSHIKPFNCTECNRPFASLYAVKIHMKTHNKTHKANKNLKNRCAICGASYVRLFALRCHLKEQHDVDIDPSQLLDSENVYADDIDVETAILMNAANGASDRVHFMDEYENDDEDADIGNAAIAGNQIDHEENIQQSITNNDYLDETEAATQTILDTEEIIVDNFHDEEIITDW